MCQGGVSVTQLATMIEMTEETVKLAQGWATELAHLAGHAALACGTEFEEAASKLGEAQALLERACMQTNTAAEAGGDHVHVERV
ncbi:MAG: hypothetical protein FWG78_03130 [Coriobacteriia bacterium]|nr:hypothetical protein [Coriobacteriia bacterium]